MSRSTQALLFGLLFLPVASATAQGTLERIAQRGEFRVGYEADARPLSFEQDGEPAGYSVDICRRVAAAIREHLDLPDMKVTFVPVTVESRFDAVVDGDVDIECGSTTVTLGRQERVDFTLMTFVTGGTVLSMSKDPIKTMKDLDGKRVAVIRGTTTETALATFLADNLIDARVVKVGDRDAALEQLRGGEVAAYASDQIVLLGDALDVLERDRNVSFAFAEELFSFEPHAFIVRRNDADFRLVVNRAIAQLFRNGQHAELYQTWVGSAGVQPSPMLIAMYQVQTLSE